MKADGLNVPAEDPPTSKNLHTEDVSSTIHNSNKTYEIIWWRVIKSHILQI